MSRFPRVATLFVLSLLVLGCRSDAPPVAPAPPGLAHQPAFRAGDSVPALFALRVDPATLTATAEPIQGRRGAGFQGSLFDLDLTRFQTWRQFRIAGVRLTGLDFIEISFAHAHPFPAPMLDAPPSGLNRADLGYTGRALLLADLSTEEEPAHTFFGDIKAKTELVVQPDGYVNPGDLLSAAALRANTFPYMLLVDEQKDNRVGISNGSVSPPGVVNGTGNYDPASRGWQRANLGDGNTGWTGYDFLHAGQEALNTFTLDPAHLPAGGELTVALLIKYTEPKGSGTRALRLPPAEVDPLQFAYRLPHAALDASVITPDWSNSAAAFYERTLRSPWAGVQVEAAVGKTSTPLQIRVRDWDAQAPEAAGPDVSQSPSVGVIEPGTGGAPAAELHCPSLAPAPVPFSAVDPAAPGLPAQELIYSVTLTNERGGIPETDHPALIRLTDPEAAAMGVGPPHAGLDPETLAPDPARALPPVNYQAYTVRVVPDAPTWNTHLVDPDTVLEATPTDNAFLSLAINPHGVGSADDRLAIAYTDSANAILKLAQALVLAPTSPADWQIHTVDGDSNVGWAPSLTDYQGRLAVSYFAYGRKLRLARALTETPTAAGDWAIGEVGFISRTAEPGQNRLIVGPTGRLVAAYAFGEGFVDLRVAQALVDAPVGLSDWQVHTPCRLTQAWPWNQGLAMGLIQGRVALATGCELGALAIARVPEPTAPGDWDWFPVPGAWYIRWPTAIAEVDGRPLIQAGILLVARKPRPVSPLDWRQVHFPFPPEGGSLYQLNDRLRTEFVNQRSLAAARALLPEPRTAFDWQISFADIGMRDDDGGYMSSLPFAGRMVIAYEEDPSLRLHLTWNQDPW